MQTIEHVIKNRKTQAIDGRDTARLVDFLTAEQCEQCGIKFKEGYTHQKTKEFTEENVIKQLKDDVEFGFEKALNKRGLSASAMFSVVAMWLEILEIDFDKDNYAYYGLPLFKFAAEKFGFDNPIGDMVGNEFIFSSESDEYF